MFFLTDIWPNEYESNGYKFLEPPLLWYVANPIAYTGGGYGTSKMHSAIAAGIQAPYLGLHHTLVQ